ncbi:alginate export family protein [Sphingomonas sp.]|uniref:alginate export family protein n=1 Tax=Sphingomonas sp. TaxID=28214 RepID=UPI001B2E4DC7|nr:alginate export family protein [Sphingomonas sp.]MBO9712002.1 alginate export family protein [Sphingomonas sp.]
MRRLALLLLLAAPAARAQDSPVDQVNWRYDEDWSAIAGKDPASLPGWTKAKYIPLDADGDVWLSTGLEARARHEGYTGNEWGSADAPDDGATWVRLMPHAELHAGPVRAFVQGIAGYALGLRPDKGPSDETGIDLLQGFADARLPIGPATLTLRGGRELVALGSERLVGVRYGPNIPQPFDGVRAIADMGKLRVQLLRLRPVVIGLGDFDDRTSDTRRLSGVYATLHAGRGALDAYWLAYENDHARFDQGGGAEHRDTWGLRFAGKRAGLSWNWEAMLQRGRFAGAPIRAWSMATETGYRVGRASVRLRANVVSGDKDRHDPALQAFDPMFPKGKYFGELSPLGPYNLMNLHPTIAYDLTPRLTLSATGIAYWRQSRGDGIYGLPGNLIRSGANSRARHIGDQGELLLEWAPTPLLSFTASWSCFTAGRFIRETGPAKTIHMIGLEAQFRL